MTNAWKQLIDVTEKKTTFFHLSGKLIGALLSLMFFFVIAIPANAHPFIQRGFSVTSVCPFTIANGPKSSTNVFIECFSNTSCSGGSDYAGGYGAGTPTFNDGPHSLSNDSLTPWGFSSAGCSTAQSIKLTIDSSGSSASICMLATVSGGNLWTCTGGPYTLTLS